eukprot:scaffold6292_cov85-Skeletonema_menzelii.AAC.1
MDAGSSPYPKIPMSTGAEARHPQLLSRTSALQHEKSPVHVPAATAVRLRDNRRVVVKKRLDEYEYAN